MIRTSNNEPIEYFFSNYVFYDPFRIGFIKASFSKIEFKLFDENKSIYLDNYDDAAWVSNYKYVLGLKSGNSGITIFNYNNLDYEVKKQTFLNIKMRKSRLALENYINPT